MVIIIVYAIVVFAVSIAIFWLIHPRSTGWWLIIVSPLVAPLVMQVTNYALLGYIDPFWKFAMIVQALIAFFSTGAAMAIWYFVVQELSNNH